MQSGRNGGSSTRGGAVDAALWVLAGTLLGLSIALSLDPEPEALSRLDLSDALLHLVGYGALTAAWLFAGVWRPGRGSGLLGGSGGIVVLAIVGLGLALEAIQAPIPHRDANWQDALANVVGVGTAWWVWRAVKSMEAGRRLGRRPRRRDRSTPGDLP
jgi:VanZ family protein